MADPTTSPTPFPPRRRVVAREVSAADVEEANRRASLVTPADLMVTPPVTEGEVETVRAPAEPVIVVDPTTLGVERRRRRSHHRLYRWTQFCTLLSAGLSATAVICGMADEIGAARICAIAGLAIALVGTALSGRSSLSARWRGWAIAAVVFAAASLALTWILPAMTADGPADRGAPPRARAPRE
jgi:hypothetical protein